MISGPRIIVESGRLRGQIFPVPEEARLTLGRDTRCLVRLPDAHISRVHCTIVRDGDEYVLEDRSQNGTFVNGEPVDRAELSSGDMIRVGETFLSFFERAGDPLVGTKIAGYHIVDRVGRGGMGTVYRAIQISLDRQVALKILSRDLTEDEEFIRRFLDEGRSAGRLNHPNIVQVHTAGRFRDNYFLSMDYMAGGSLEALLYREGPVPTQRLFPWMLDALRGLAWAQTRGIVHRDIKPDNLLLAGDGTLKIGDFGVAADCRRSKTIYQGGKVVGTPVYMAPEQALGNPVDHRADIYSLGATFYRALSGARPFDGETPAQILLKKVKGAPEPLDEIAPNLPRQIVRIVQKMMSFTPEERFQDAAEVYRHLDRLHRSGGLAAEPPRRAVSPVSQQSSPSSRERGPGPRRVAALLLVATAALIACLGFWKLRSLDNAPPRQTSGALEQAATRPGPTGGTDRVATLEDRRLEEREKEGREELTAIRDGARSRTLSLALAETRLNDFEKRFPGERWKTLVENVRADLESLRVTRAQAALKMLRDELATLVDEGRFLAAAELIDEFVEAHPEIREGVDLARHQVDSAAREALRAARETAAKAMAREDSSAALSAVLTLAPRLPPSLAEEATTAIDGLNRQIEESAIARQKHDAAAALVVSSFRSLEFEPAEASLADLVRSEDDRIAARARELQKELRCYRDVLERLQVHLREGARVRIGRGEEISERRVLGVSGSTIRLARRSGAPESVSLTLLGDDELVRILRRSSDELSSEMKEALGIFLLHAAGPARAWRFLTDPELGEELRRHYRERLTPELRRGIRTRFQEVVARVAESRDREETPERPAEELVVLEELIRDARSLSEERELRADLAAVYLECRRRLLRVSAPGILFHATKVDPTPSGVDLVYDFRSEEELRDFAAQEGGTLRLVRRGLVEMRGEHRLLHGDPFRDRLRIRGVVRKFPETAPNVGVAVWTREGEVLPALRASSRAEESQGSSVLGFSLGFHASTGFSSNGMPYIPVGGFELQLPANVVLGGRRQVESGSPKLSPFRALWARRPSRGYRAPLAFEIGIEPGSVSWRTGREILPVENVNEEIKGSVHGSVTFSTNGPSDPVYYSTLTITADLDPFWPEDEIARQAMESLRGLDPELPFANLELPLEETLRGPGYRRRAHRVLFSDDFRGELRPEWKIRHEHASHWSLTKRAGTLTITTERGALVGSSRSYKNLFLIPNPAGSGDFEIRTRLLGFRPTEEVQQAGLVCVVDDDNYIKATVEFARGERRLILLREVGGKNIYLQSPLDPERTTVWLRLRRQGHLYSLAASADGEVFEWQGELPWGEPAPKYLGLLAKNSLQDAPEIDASFDLFEVLSPLSAARAR